MSPPAFDLQDSPGYLIARTAQALSRELAAELRPLQLTPPQWAVLQAVAEHPGSAQREVAEAIAMDAPTLTELATRLAARELLTRSPDPADGRRLLLTLTPRGEHAVGAARGAAGRVNARATQMLTPDEIALLKRLMSAIWAGLR